MAVLQCKICGGKLNPPEGATVFECEWCGNPQTLPKFTDDNTQGLFNRANELRQRCEFDKAEALYEDIIKNNPEDAESYWGMVLCRFGIEYVKDPDTGNYMPTCHRASYDSILADGDYQKAVQYADGIQRPVYERDAKLIDRTQSRILEISSQEEPYDVFICYKEKDPENPNERTRDALKAGDIYDELTEKGYKVFYSHVTLDEKAGSEYEPIIFAALNSAKVMVVVGSKPEYFESTWVRNEWSRYLRIQKKDRSRLIIPCYLDMDPYLLPSELKRIQAYDMTHIGFLKDLIRGIQKVIPKEDANKSAAAASAANSAVVALLKRAFLFLEDEEFERADDLCEQVLNQDPENARAYVGKLLADMQVPKIEELADLEEPFDDEQNYKKAIRFGDAALKNQLEGYNSVVRRRNAEAHQEEIYDRADRMAASFDGDPEELIKAAKLFASIPDYRDAKARAEAALEEGNSMIYADALHELEAEDFDTAYEWFQSLCGYRDSEQMAAECLLRKREKAYQDALKAMNDAKLPRDFENAANLFRDMGAYRDAADKVQECLRLEAEAKKNVVYNKAVGLCETDDIKKLEQAVDLFAKIPGWKDADQRGVACAKRLEDTKKRKAQALRVANRNRKIRTAIILVVVFAVVGVGAYFGINTFVIKPAQLKKEADALMAEGKYEEAYKIYDKIGKDEITDGHKIDRMLEMLRNDDLEGALELYAQIEGSKTHKNRMGEVEYEIGCVYLELADDAEAYSHLINAVEYSDAETRIQEIRDRAIQRATALVAESKYDEAYEELSLYGISEEDPTYSMIEMLKEGDYRGAVDAGLTQLILPAGMTEIEEYMFRECEGLTSVVIPNTVTTIGNSAFAYCTGLTSVEIPGSVTVIGDNAFYNCSNLTSVTLSEGLDEIGSYAFKNCTSLTEIAIPDTVTVVSYEAFRGCTGLTSMVFPDSIQELGGDCLYECTSLTELTVPFVGQYSDARIASGGSEGNTTMSWIFDGQRPEQLTKITVTSATELRDSAFENWTNLTTLILPDTLTVIGADAFYGCTGLTSFTIRPGVTTIGNNAFRGCTGFTAITIPGTVTSIGTRAFQGCTGLTSVTIDEGVTTIGERAFIDCTGLTSFTLPSSILELDYYILYGCTGITELTVPFVGQYSDAKITELGKTGNTTLDFLFDGISESVTKVTVTGGSKLRSNAFSNWKKLTTVVLPDTLTAIEEDAFYECWALTNVNIPSNVTSIGDDAFNYCYSLMSVTIPAKLTGIGNNAFRNCYSLVEVYNLSAVGITAGATSQGYVAEHALAVHTDAAAESILIREGDYAFYMTGGTYNLLGYTGTEQVLTLPDQVKESGYAIAAYAFYKNQSIISVEMPDSVTAVGDYAFHGCSALSSVTLSAGMERIGDEAFYNCKNITEIYLPESLTFIGKNAFGSTGLTNVTFGDTTGWATRSNLTSGTATNRSSDDLSNSIQAANWLKSNYSSYYWVKESV